METLRIEVRPRSVARAWLASVALGSSVVGSLIVGGCCDESKREMDRLADKYYQQAFACCKAKAEVDPFGGASCFDQLLAWRLATGSGILEWYQACLNGEQNLAQQLLQQLRSLVVELGQETCGTTIALADGRKMTMGVPFGPDDTLSLAGAFTGPYGLLRPPANAPPQHETSAHFTLATGRFRMQAMGATLAGALHGAVDLRPIAGDPGAYAVEGASLTFGVGAATVAMELQDPEDLSTVRLNGDVGVLEMRVAIRVDGDVPVLAPPQAWVRIPVRATPSGLAFASGNQPLLEFMPSAPGWADWNRDWTVDEADWAAFFAGPVGGQADLRDLDLDGDIDGDDIQLFTTAWQEEVAR